MKKIKFKFICTQKITDHRDTFVICATVCAENIQNPFLIYDTDPNLQLTFINLILCQSVLDLKKLI